MMLTDADKKRAAELYGPEVLRVVHGLNDLMGQYLARGDTLGFIFLVEAVSVAISRAFDIAKVIQDESKQQQVH